MLRLMEQVRATRRYGFTIVELLIVIVVIAILAAVATVAYSGIQARARNAQNVALAKSYVEGLQNYLTNNGSYPPGMDDYSCLGSHPNDVNGDGRYDCVYTGSSAEVSKSSALHDALRGYVNVDMKAADTVLTSADDKRLMGVQYWYDPGAEIDGEPHSWYLAYIQEGEGRCGYGNVLTDIGWPYYSSTLPDEGYTWLETGGYTCLIALPNPNML